MTLRLSVVSEHGMRLGSRSTKVFGVHGGSIGRGNDNAWILPDPERYLSGKHARVDFRAGKYLLVDTSSNGTYVNGAAVPLGKFHDYVLKDGDYIRLGEYELLVSIDQGNDFPPDQSAIVAYDGRAASSAATTSTANDLGADLDLSALLEPSNRLDAASTEPSPAERAPAEPAPAAQDGTPWHMRTRPIRVAEAVSPTSVRANPIPAFDGDAEAGLSAFCRGAGIDPRSITQDGRVAALQLAGQLLREAVLGLMDLNQSRDDFRNRFRLAPPAEEDHESPLDFSRGVDEALVRLLSTQSTRAGSVDALRQNFRGLKAQQAALLTAMRAAFDEFLGRVDPKELEERFDRGSKRGVFGVQNKAKYWDLYGDLYSGLAQRPAEGFPHLFNETFAKAYEAKLRTLLPPKRGAFGVEPPPDLPEVPTVRVR